MTAASGASAGCPRPASAGLRRVHAQILRQLALMAELARGPEAEVAARAPAVSGWSVAEQLEHLVLVDRAVLKSVRRILDDPHRQSAQPAQPAPPAPPAPGINLVGRVVLGTGFIPRGRARTMPPYQPGAAPAAAGAGVTGIVGIEEIERGVRELEPRLGELEASGGRSRHPLFGGLGGRQWLRFVTVHHHHHLKIVRDIRRARGLATAGLASR
ncbi:MAG TPA: DinB family protein [Thermoanaerobaculia bacterium]